jgi:agmatinase
MDSGYASARHIRNDERDRPSFTHKPLRGAGGAPHPPQIGVMTSTPTFAVRPSFLGIERADRNAAICVAGIPFDLGASNRPGARFGPAAIRQASRMLVDGDHPQAGIEPARLDIADIGDFAIAHGDIAGSLARIEQEAAGLKHLIALGGDHSVTLPLLRALAKRLEPVGLVHFDAHPDTWPEIFGLVHGHGSPFYHAIEEGLVDPHHMVQIGIRSPVQREVAEWTAAKGVTVLTAEAVHEGGPQAAAERIRAAVGEGPAYLSFDIDALDPAFAPGTGTPEVGGLATWQARAILRRLKGLAFAGMDVVEVSPPYDTAEITALAAATFAWDYIALLAPRPGG